MLVNWDREVGIVILTSMTWWWRGWGWWAGVWLGETINWVGFCIVHSTKMIISVQNNWVIRQVRNADLPPNTHHYGRLRPGLLGMVLGIGLVPGGSTDTRSSDGNFSTGSCTSIYSPGQMMVVFWGTGRTCDWVRLTECFSLGSLGLFWSW